MPPTTSYSFGDVVLVPFPFTDQSTTKKRPAVIVSSAAYHRVRPDVIIMAITSQSQRMRTLGEVVIENWKAARLLKPSTIKPVIATVERSLVIRRPGKLAETDLESLQRAIGAILGNR